MCKHKSNLIKIHRNERGSRLSAAECFINIVLRSKHDYSNDPIISSLSATMFKNELQSCAKSSHFSRRIIYIQALIALCNSHNRKYTRQKVLKSRGGRHDK